MAGHTDSADDEAIEIVTNFEQFSLFPSEAGKASRDAGAGEAALEERFAGLQALASSLPPTLRMGTSSWSFPGWRGIVYSRAMTTTELAREGLREYSRHPLLRTVGVDRSFYAPVSADDWRRYAEQVPDDFVCCVKAPASITSYTVAGSRHPIANPGFMSAARMIDELLDPCLRALGSKAGPFLLPFPPLTARATLDPVEFAEMLDGFLDRLPRHAEYAVELRDRSLLTETYRRVLSRNGVVHVCNYWSAMPMPGQQGSLVEHARGPFTMVRLLMRPGTRYTQQREAMAPFNRIVEQDEHMRRDAVDVLQRALAAGQRASLLVNNKAEGSSPLTIEAIAGYLRPPAA
ncbi:hypothetical protein BH18ACI5_BH18ACI5_01150 [soil metagenome]